MIHRQVLQGRTNREVVIGVNRVYRDIHAGRDGGNFRDTGSD